MYTFAGMSHKSYLVKHNNPKGLWLQKKIILASHSKRLVVSDRRMTWSALTEGSRLIAGIQFEQIRVTIHEKKMNTRVSNCFSQLQSVNFSRCFFSTRYPTT